MKREHILIIGAGVSGLSTGILLLKDGYDVTIWAKDLPPNTTSNKAAAVWYPFIVNPPEKATRWARATLEYFQNEVLPDASSGAKAMKVIEIFEKKVDDPWWRDGVDSFRRTIPSELPPGYIDGYAVDGLVMDTDRYIDYLVETFKKNGGQMMQHAIASFDEALKTHSVVINCTGLASRELCNDMSIFPCRGQILKIEHNGFDMSVFEEVGRNSLAYIIPRINDIVIGGTAQDNDWDLEPREEDTAEILKKCANLYPEFEKVKIKEIRVGLRPVRDEIRLETERTREGNIVHNYGHGGSGFTLSWGCAMEVVKLVKEIT